MTQFEFAKSSYSSSTGECVEVATNVPGTIAVRDSKEQPAGPILTFTPTEWTHFQRALAEGAFTE